MTLVVKHSLSVLKCKLFFFKVNLLLNYIYSEKFIDRMNEVANEEKQQTIFTDDLKTIIHVAQNDEEVNLMKVMLLR